MIHYHGSPLSGNKETAIRFFNGRHAFVSYARMDQLDVVMEVCQSFALDNGAYSAWKQEKELDIAGYKKLVDELKHHPCFDFCIIPDVIDGSEKDNDLLLKDWRFDKFISSPVWHMHESFERLTRLATTYPRICFGSSGEFATIGTANWWDRINQAFDCISNKHGQVSTKVHGLRLLNPAIFTKLPFASADSTNVARNIGTESRWKGAYQPVSMHVKAICIADRIESYNSANCYTSKPVQQDLF